MGSQHNGARALGGAVVVAAFAIWRTPDPRAPEWLGAALLFAALVLVPLALPLFAETKETAGAAKLLRQAGRWQLPAGGALAVACGWERGALAAGLALPWMTVTALLAGAGFLRLQHGGLRRELHVLAADIALIFAAVGGAWTLADRGGFRPLGFDPQIVTLTAVHFHYAGLLLPLLAGLAQQQLWMSPFAARAVVGSVLGVPAVALGITTSQLGWSRAIEAGAGSGMALAGMAVGILHVRLALEAKWPLAARAGLGVAGVSLFFAMVLALGYAGRAFVPAAAALLTIPHMQAIHGTLNAVGFGLGGVLAWRAVAGRSSAGPVM
jgi:hypothetical protein